MELPSKGRKQVSIGVIYTISEKIQGVLKKNFENQFPQKTNFYDFAGGVASRPHS